MMNCTRVTSNPALPTMYPTSNPAHNKNSSISQNGGTARARTKLKSSTSLITHSYKNQGTEHGQCDRTEDTSEGTQCASAVQAEAAKFDVAIPLRMRRTADLEDVAEPLEHTSAMDQRCLLVCYPDVHGFRIGRAHFRRDHLDIAGEINETFVELIARRTERITKEETKEGKKEEH